MSEPMLQAVEARLRASGRFELETAGVGALVAGRHDTPVKVVIRLQRSGDTVALVMYSPICHEHAAPARTVLAAAAQMGAGAIALVDRAYVVRYSIPAAGVTGAPLAQIATYVADLAAELAITFASHRSALDPGVFSHVM
jgi:hypothetical protein